MSLFIPFNFQPVSTDAKNSASYTVPNGKYALVTASISSSGVSSTGSTVTLNGVNILEKQDPSIGNVDSRTTTTDGTFVTSNTDQVIDGQIFVQAVTSAVTIDLDGDEVVQQAAGTNGTYPIKFGDGQVLGATIPSSGTAAFTGISYYKVDTTSGDSISFWAKSGDVITGTGIWNIVASEYNNIS
jgi:hypothetical protein